MLKVLWQYAITEGLGLLNHEAIAFACPRYDLLRLWIVDDLE